MTTKTIEITIQPDGATSVRTKGFTGPSCREASRFIEDSLGKRTDEVLTTEYHRSEASQQTNERAT